MSGLLGLTFDWLASHEVAAAHTLEEQAFPPEEAATLAKFQYRQENAPHLFLGAFIWRPPAARALVAYICATACSEEHLTLESMSEHDPNGSTVCIHAVVVEPSMRQRGLAEALLKEYVSRLKKQSDQPWRRASLLAHLPLVPLYQRCGFENLGPSSVVYGPDTWLEMSIDLHATGQRNPRIPFTAVAKRPEVLFVVDTGEKEDKVLVNAGDIYCPRRQCRSLILRKGCARWQTGSIAPLHDPQARPTPSLPDFPPDTKTGDVPCWSVVPPSPMTFENVSVSKPVPSSPGMKYLGCADCDCGPLGWISSEEVILDAARLRYKLHSG